MANWYGNRHNETYTYKRVRWNDWTEGEAYGFITSGSVEMSADAELKVTGSFDFEGTELPDVSDLIRIYYSFLDDSGEKEKMAIATLLTSYADLTYVDTKAGLKASGSLEGSSILKVLQDKIVGRPYTIKKNENMIYKAQEIIRSCGLNVDYVPSVKVMAADHVFDTNATYLDIVNWLTNAAGYSDAFPDPYGTVRLYPESDKRKEVTATFKNNEESIMYPELSQSNDWQETPNVVKLLYNTDASCVAAEARNLTGSRTSLDQRGGRELVYFDEVGELDRSDVLVNLMDLAEKTLREKSCDVEYVTFSHAYIPVNVFDLIRIRYADMDWTGVAQNISISLEPSTKTQTKLKRELYSMIQVKKNGEILRGGNT